MASKPWSFAELGGAELTVLAGWKRSGTASVPLISLAGWSAASEPPTGPGSGRSPEAWRTC
eukprot:9884124-Alexandrium_andersonii.AAC.1